MLALFRQFEYNAGTNRYRRGKAVKTSDFDYDLPPHLIAQTPIEPRDASRLMVLSRARGTIEHRLFRDIAEYLRPGDVLVCNDSRVIPARLYGRKEPTGGKVELLLVAKRDEDTWEALVRGRRVRVGTRIRLQAAEQPPVYGEVRAETESGGRLVAFSTPLEPLLDDLGVVPLPPYIHESLAEPERYQTIYARSNGSVAAPTAGLHFTPQLMEGIEAKGMEFAFVTLNIGLDTFRPVRTEELEEHRLHSEYCCLSPMVADRLNRAKREGRRIVAVGTTSVRVLETAARVGKGEPLSSFAGWTKLFIYPGFRFRVVDALITNFHLPRSTLLMLVAAFAGKERIDRAYREAIKQGYRFYSFGDCMLLS